MGPRGSGKARGGRRAGSRGAGKAPSDSYNRLRAGSCLDVSILVEAGAGTGKTALLLERLRNIICSRDVPMEGLVAITFTEKAAGELKSRIREELEKWELEAGWPLKERLQAAIREMDRAVVSTIHSFCSTLLRERPVEAGVDPGFRVADAVESEELFDIAWEQWLQARMTPENLKLRRVFAMGCSLRRVKDLAAALAAHRHMTQWAPGRLSLESPSAVLGGIRDESAKLAELARLHLKNPDDRLAPEIRKLERFLRRALGLADQAGWDALLPAVAQLNVKTGRRGSAENWSSKGALETARGILADVGERLEGVRKALGHNAVVDLTDELKILLEIYAGEKRERGVLDFDDLLIGARDLLRDSAEARSYFKKKFRFILIDEFQDTDPLQAEVAFFLAEKLDCNCDSWEDADLEAGKLFIVGDPKQSIYRFRGADIEVYERSKAALAKSGEILQIFVNFRSTPGVIEPVNLTFKEVMRPPAEGFYQPKYIPLDEYREGAGPGVALLRPAFALPEGLSADEKRAFEASAVAWSIHDSVRNGRWTIHDKARGENRPAGYGDVAVLFWATTGLGVYEEALRSWDIPYRVAGGKAFYSRAEIQSLVSVLSAVENPHDGVAVVGALRSTFFGLSDEEIFLHWASAGSLDYTRVGADGPVARAFGVLRALRENRNRERLGPFLRGLFEVTGALPVFYMRPHGEQRVANLLKISAMAARLEESGPVTFKRFVRWVAEQGERGVEEGESPIREAGDDFASVLTIHKAKGLESPVVFLPGLWTSGRKGVESIVADRGRRDLQVSLSKMLGLVTEGWDAASRREAEILDAERIRLLYVAMTRARDKLVLPLLFAGDGASEEASGGKTPEGRGAGQEPSTRGAGKAKGLMVHLKPLIDRALEGGAKWCETIEIPPAGLETRRERALRVAERESRERVEDYTALNVRWRSSLETALRAVAVARPVTSPTALLAPPRMGAAAAAASPGGAGEAGSGGGAGEAFRSSDTGRRVGKLVHSVLEAAGQWEPGLMRDLAASLGAELGLRREAIDHAAQMLQRFSGSPFAGRLRAARRTRKEVPFCVSLTRPEDGAGARAEPVIVEGSADLLIEEEDGWRVVDFKTDDVDEDGVDERAGHYKPQGACYALCLSKILDRPIKEVIFYFLSPQKAHVFAVDELFLDEAARAAAR